jgi:hypothetical protein
MRSSPLWVKIGKTPQEHISSAISVSARTWSTIKHCATLFGKGVAYISVTIAALSFLQRQEPLKEIHLNHWTKTLSIRNNGFVPFRVTAKAFLFELDWNLIGDEKPIARASTLGTLFDGDIIWPFQKYFIKLTEYKQLEFQKMGPVPGKKLYCIVVSFRNPLSNQLSSIVQLTPSDLFPASLFGPWSKQSSGGGDYEAVKRIMVVEDKITQDCLRLQSKLE